LVDEAVEAIADLGPKAIGIDIDVSPDENGWPIRPNDWQIFERWKKLGASTHPVIVKAGVFRRLADGPSNWLGRPEFADLAAGVVARPDPQFNYYYVSAGHGRLPELAAALYLAATKGEHPECTYLNAIETGDHGLLPILHEGKRDDVNWGYYAINYAYRAELKAYRLQYSGKDSVKAFRDRIRNNVVFIGDINVANDQVRLAQANETVAGVVVQACSYMTLADKPLRYVDEERSTLFDFSLSVLSLLLIAFLPSFLHVKNPNFHRAELRSRMVIAPCLLVPCCFLVGWLRIFWPDVFWIALALCLDPLVAEPFWKGIKMPIVGISGWIREGFAHE
jgi:CHASE2 domain-containing sensor protein